MDAPASTDLFINLIQNHPIIYDKSLKDFKNTRKKEDAWADIACQARMDVDAAKKRYFSLRQKYCREKKNIEVKRRNKLVHRNTWVFYGRLHFLDAFIQPRSTFTNDTGFLDDLDQSEEALIEDEGANENFNETSAGESQNILIEVAEGVTADDLNNLTDDQNNIDQAATQNGNDHNVKGLEVPSDYSGDISQIFYLSESARRDSFSQNDEPPVNTENIEAEREEFDPDYNSPHPSTSSSDINSSNTSTRNCTADKNAFNFPRILTATMSHSVSTGTSSACRPPPPSSIISSQLQSHRETVVSTNSTPRHTTSTSKSTARSSLSNKTTANSYTNTTQKSSQPCSFTTTSTTPNDKGIEMIRHKMDSCLTAIQNKMTDKQHRSPHAPFLAYLGTKLAKVPIEILSTVEEEILDIVKNYSK